MTTKPDVECRLLDAGNALGLCLAPGQTDVLLAYIDQLQRWNRVYNLTSLRDPEQMLTHHVVDSLSVVLPMRNAIANNAIASRPGPVTVVDVGSGAGLPGVVLAATNPDWDVFCVDAVEKKVAFMRQMRGALRLPKLHAVHGRIESLPAWKADIVVSRAFASLADFARLAGTHVASHGCMLAMKGRTPTEEMASWSLSDQWVPGPVEQLSVPGLDAQRCLVWMYPHQGTI